MELRHLRYFIKAAELMNFTKAAETLYVSQPTLSVQIHQLEEELGTELFARVGRNVRLTESGKVFLVRALQAVRELEEAGEEIDALKGLLRGTICVGSLPLYGSKLIAGWVSAFNEIHPNVHVTFKAAPTEDIEAGVIAGIIDLGFVILPLQHVEINSKALFQDEVVLVASKKHEIAKKASVEISDFGELLMALPSERISAARMMLQYFEKHKIDANIQMSFDDGHALLELVKYGKFVTFLPRWLVRNEPDLCTFPLPLEGIPVATGVVWTHLSPAAKAFLELMTKEAMNHA